MTDDSQECLSWFTYVCFLNSKDGTAEYFMKYSVDIAPRKVEMAKSDGGLGELEREFAPLCTREKIEQELTTADIPEPNGVAERYISILGAVDLAARIQASERYPNEVSPNGESL